MNTFVPGRGPRSWDSLWVGGSHLKNLKLNRSRDGRVTWMLNIWAPDSSSGELIRINQIFLLYLLEKTFFYYFDFLSIWLGKNFAWKNKPERDCWLKNIEAFLRKIKLKTFKKRLAFPLLPRIWSRISSKNCS